MSDVTRILSAIESGDPTASEHLLPLVYSELRNLAAQKLAHERPDHTLQATALVHEAYIRLVHKDRRRSWTGRGHFFAAAAEAMRRILVESARRKGRQKRGGEMARLDFEQMEFAIPMKPTEAIAVDAALEKLEAKSQMAAELVKLRYFGGFSGVETAEILGISPRKADQIWTYARACLLAEIEQA